MPREVMCQHGNCIETDTPISVNYRNEERPRFCCEEHAALWLLRRGYGVNVQPKEAVERLAAMLNH